MTQQRQEYPDDFYERPARRARRSPTGEDKSVIEGVRPKVAAALVAGSLVTVLTYILNEALGIQPPPEVVAAVTTLFAVLGGYLQNES
jgi:hypothetical protein